MIRDNTCGHCGAKLKRWNDLSDDERLLAERLPSSADYTLEERKTHRFCTRCWNEETAESEKIV